MEPRELQGEHKDDGSGGRWAVRSHSAGLWMDGPVVRMQGSRGGVRSPMLRNGWSNGEDAGKGRSVLPCAVEWMGQWQRCREGRVSGSPRSAVLTLLFLDSKGSEDSPRPRCSGLDISPQSPPLCSPAR